MWKHEKELDSKGEKGSTVDPSTYEITDELIEKIRVGDGDGGTVPVCKTGPSG